MGTTTLTQLAQSPIPTGYYLCQMDNTGTGNTCIYMGYAQIGNFQNQSGSVMVIQKNYLDGNNLITSIGLASVTNAGPATNLIWNNRTSYTYT